MKIALAFTAACVALGAAADVNLQGTWHAQGAGIDADLTLPGTLADAKLGTRWTYETFKACKDRPQTGALVREYQHLGKVRYSRKVTLGAEECKGGPLELSLERVMWASTVSFDGTPLGTCDSLAAPHVYAIPASLATPGEHVLVVEVDNSPRHGFSRYSHSYGPVMQSVWHGLLGELSIRRAHPLRTARVFADAPTKGVFRVEVPTSFDPSVPGVVSVAGLTVRFRSAEPSPYRASAQLATFEIVGGEPTYWSEHHPKLYTLVLIDRKCGFTHQIRFGFRTITTDPKTHGIFVNGHRTFLRTTLECCNFALTGAPAMTKGEWSEIFRRLKYEDGLNAVRFHSWTPPKAAFEAADGVGLYLMPEADIWTDGWMTGADQVGHGKSVDAFVLREFDAILGNYGNSPSFATLAIGNELGGAEFNVCGGWMKDLKRKDPRRLYFVSTARALSPGDEIEVTHAIPGVGSCRTHLEASTDWDYEKVYSRGKVPVLSHEIGQWPVYPMWEELGKYQGVLKPWNIEQYRRVAEANGVLDRNRKYHDASAKLSRLFYKDEVESFLRTPSCAGCELLGVQDFTGQGEALIGWRDPFYDLKLAYKGDRPFVDIWGAQNFLARISKYVWTADETFKATLQFRNLTEQPVKAGARLPYVFAGVAGEFTVAKDILPGELSTVGVVEFDLGKVQLGAKQSRALDLKFGTNHWRVWLYPAKEVAAALPSGVVETADFEVAKQVLAKGGKVLFTGTTKSSTRAKFRAVYWSANWFPSRDRLGSTLGVWFDVEHPVFAGFETENWTDWQWYRLMNGAKIYDLSALPRDFAPMALSVNDFHYNILSGEMFEAKVGKGYFFACGFDLTKDLPEVKRLRASVYSYLAKGDFRQAREVKLEALEEAMGPKAMGKPGKVKVPAEYAASPLYIEAATGVKVSKRNCAWDRAEDGARVASGASYSVEGIGSHFGSWRDEDGSYWFGKKMKVTITGLEPVQGQLLIRFRDPNRNGRTGKFVFEGTTYEVPMHQQNPQGIWWAKVPLIRENFLDGKLELTTEVKTGPNLMIDRIVVLP